MHPYMPSQEAKWEPAGAQTRFKHTVGNHQGMQFLGAPALLYRPDQGLLQQLFVVSEHFRISEEGEEEAVI